MTEVIRVGIVGLGANTRSRHVPGLLKCDGVKLQAVCNRSAESSQRAADEYGIPLIFSDWQELVESDDVDAVVIGTWPYLHCPITVAALDAGKHVLTEARMAMDASEARQMDEAAARHAELTAKIVPSPLGLRGHDIVTKIVENELGDLREIAVLGTSSDFADPQTPLHWRQSKSLSGINMLALGILHEPLVRWVDDPVRVTAQTHIVTPQRVDPQTGEMAEVGTPDIVHVLTELPNGARGIYHLSGVTHSGPGMQIHLYGSRGTLKYEFAPRERILFGHAGEGVREVPLPDGTGDGWRVEEEFVAAIRGLEQVHFNDFKTGLRYMLFTQAVADSAAAGKVVEVPSS